MKFESTVNFGGIEFEVSGGYVPPVSGRQYLRNGDPGWPDEGDCFEEFDIGIGGVSIYDLLTGAAADGIEELALEEARAAAEGRRGTAWA